MNCINHFLSSASISIFSLQISNFHYIRKYRYTSNLNTWFLILFTFFESIKVFLINMFAVLMTSAKMATLGLLKEKFFWRFWRQNLCPRRHQQNFITWLKLYCWCGHLIKFVQMWSSLLNTAFLWQKLS